MNPKLELYFDTASTNHYVYSPHGWKVLKKQNALMKLFRLINKQWLQFPYESADYIPGLHVLVTEDLDFFEVRYDNHILINYSMKANSLWTFTLYYVPLEVTLIKKRLMKRKGKYFKSVVKLIYETL